MKTILTIDPLESVHAATIASARTCLLSLLLSVASAIPCGAQQVLVPAGSEWRYLNNNIDQGTAWIATNFDDSAWSSGLGPLGVNDSGITTTIDIGPANFRYTTVYFRKRFNVPDASGYGGMRVRLNRDDGAAIYLNGNPTPIVRDGVAEGATFYDWASQTVANADEFAYYISDLNYSKLVTGTNVLAVEVHQAAATSSDLGFDLEISGIRRPEIVLTSPTNGLAFDSHVAVLLEAAGSSVDGQITKVEFYQDNSRIGLVTGSPYRLTWTNAAEGIHRLAAVAYSSFGIAATSAPVSVTITDTNPPVLVSASARSNSVTVVFSKSVTLASATNVTNYHIDHGVSVLLATANPAVKTVVLDTTPLAYDTTYVLTVNGIQDSLGNRIATNSQTSFTPLPFQVTGIGATGSATVVPGGHDVSATGGNLGGTNDALVMDYQSMEGNFDLAVRVAAMSVSDAWAKAGLMARVDITAGSPYAAALAKAAGGCFFSCRTLADGAAATRGSFPVNYPYTWLRLRRSGNTFDGLASLDGQSWVPLGSADIAMPNSVLVGFAVSATSSNTSTMASFRDLGPASGMVVSNLAFPFEPMAPCSRRTGLVISEIMYNPPDRWSTGRLEYIELHNPDLFSEDLSGYRLGGDIDYTFPAGTSISSGEYLVIARSPGAVESYYGVSGVLGPYTNSLQNQGGTVRLINERGGHVLEVNYDNRAPWPVAADGAGHSLVLRRPSHGENDPRAWGISDVVGGSPGRPDGWGAERLRNVVINEFLANSDGATLDFVELYNAANQPVDLSGAWLSDNPSTNKFRIPDGTVLGARGYVAFDQGRLGFALDSKGEQIYLVNSNQTRVIDAWRFGAQAANTSRGRSPDGSPLWSELASPTPGTNNAPALMRSMVINEIMYDPISGLADDEYIELHNRGAASVDISGWRLSDGIGYVFPSNVVVTPGAFVVVAANLTNLLAKYPHLATALAYGDLQGNLKNSGERVSLDMPMVTVETNSHGVTITNLSYVSVNEVTYRSGGRWGEWSGGGGSSLELKDARSDNRFAANWADSDESAKATWTTIEFTGAMDNGMTSGQGTPSRFEFYLQGAGECLVDDLEFRMGSGTNLLQNSGFENGLTSWTFQGSHRLASLETNEAFSGSKCLHVVATDRGDAGPNRIWAPISLYTSYVGSNATIRAKVRWLRGTPEILFRLRGNWIEATATMNVPANPGTPGLPNSRRVDNAGPAIAETTHFPVLPGAGQPAVVSARVSDPDGVGAVTLRYRIDPSTAYVNVPMNDAGTNGDALAGDGIYSGPIAGQAAGAVVAFYVAASDKAGAQSAFPKEAPGRECLVCFGLQEPLGSVGTYRIWMSQANLDWWNARERNSNEPLDCTFAYGNHRVIYNAGTLYSGSPWHTANHPYNGPLGNVCDYELNFKSDEPFIGATDFVLNGQGPVENFFEDDLTAQAEYTAYWFGRKLGLVTNHKRVVRLFFNSRQRGLLYFDHQQPNSEIIDTYFPNDTAGHLHKIEDWFEFDDAGNGFDIITATLEDFTTTGGAKKAARYRYNWRPRAVSGSPNDFADLFYLVDAVNAPLNDAFVTRSFQAMDVEEWMRHFALQHMVGNWDTYGYRRGKNCFAYKPDHEPWKLLLWDLDIVLGKQSDGPSQPLMDLGGAEPVVQRMYDSPPFARAFWRAMNELATRPMQPDNYGPLMQERYQALVANGLDVKSPTTVASWIDQRRNFILTQIPAANFTVDGGDYIEVNSNAVVMTGSAPVSAKSIAVNGTAYPVTWITTTTWRTTVPLEAGANSLTIQGLDLQGEPLAGAVRSVTVNNTGTTVSPVGTVVINEIMYHPQVEGASYVELYNRSTNTIFDLSNWQFHGLAYTFPPGAILPPRGYLVLAKDRLAFSSAYGSAISVYDVFSGNLQADGETLTLIKPGPTPEADLVIDKVKYEDLAPWPTLTANKGASLQLVDSAQDNSRVCNWTEGVGWRFVSFTGTPAGNTLNLYLNAPGDVYLDDITLVKGTVAGVGSNYIVNGGFEKPLTNGWKTVGTATNSSVSTTVGRLGGSSLHMVVRSPAGTSARMYQTPPGLVQSAVHTLSFWYLPANTNLFLTNWFSSSFIFGTSLRQNVASPGASNALASVLPTIPDLWLNEAQPSNTTGPTDQAGEHEPWIELYNSGTNVVSLQGLYLADNYTNLAQWAFPTGAVIQPGEFKVVFADGQTNQSTLTELHTSFRIAPTNGTIALVRNRNGLAEVLDYLTYEGVPADYSYGSLPDGQPFTRQLMYYATPRQANNGAGAPVVLWINEWMAANTLTLPNPVGGSYDDWFELYNPNGFDVDLTGWSLANSLTNWTQNVVPSGYHVPSQGCLLVWADGKPGRNSTNQPDLHVNFKLAKSGDTIALYAPDGRLVDSVSFGTQFSDVSEGRYPDGSTAIMTLSAPTPGWKNGTQPPTPPLMAITLAENQVHLIFRTVPGVAYQVEYRDTMDGGVWTDLGPSQVATGLFLTAVDTTDGKNQRFYRVVQVP